MTEVKKDRRKKISKPKIFNERRASMMLIEVVSPVDFFLWIFSILIMFTFLAGVLFYSLY